MAQLNVKELIDSGIHFGHRTSRWNPKMAPYIFGKRNTIHILDIRETVKGLLRAKRFLTKMVADGKDVLFVGTKRQARKALEEVTESNPEGDAKDYEVHREALRALDKTFGILRSLRPVSETHKQEILSQLATLAGFVMVNSELSGGPIGEL